MGTNKPGEGRVGPGGGQGGRWGQLMSVLQSGGLGEEHPGAGVGGWGGGGTASVEAGRWEGAGPFEEG